MIATIWGTGYALGYFHHAPIWAQVMFGVVCWVAVRPREWE
jgi:hypothetical protein